MFKCIYDTASLGGVILRLKSMSPERDQDGMPGLSFDLEKHGFSQVYITSLTLLINKVSIKILHSDNQQT